MIEQLIDGEKRGGVLRLLPAVRIRYNTQAATPGNTVVALRLMTPVICLMDWGDGNIELIRPSTFAYSDRTDAYEIQHTYSLAGAYNARLLSIAGSRVQLKSNADSFSTPPPPSLIPPNLYTRIEYEQNGRYAGYRLMLRGCSFVTEVVFPPGEGMGLLSRNMSGALSYTGITSLPAFNITQASTNMWKMCEGVSTLSSVSSLLTASTSLVSNWGLAFYQCTGLTSFPVVDMSGGITFDGTWARCSSLTSFPSINISNGSWFGGTWFGCTGLTSFPLLDFRSALALGGSDIDFGERGAWEQCTNLTVFPVINTANVAVFDRAWYGCSGLTSFPQIVTSSGIRFIRTWWDCSKLTSFPLLDFSAATSLQTTWANCSGLTSFPAIITSKVLTFGAPFNNGLGAWGNCSGLTTFPVIDTSKATSIQAAWYGCTGLTSFPALNFGEVRRLGTIEDGISQGAWQNCTKLTSFPSVTFPKLSEDARYGWYGCTSLVSFPANVFNGCTCTRFDHAFDDCALNATSVNNILVSIASCGTSNGVLGMSGGTNAAPTGAGITAKSALIARGWVVTTN